MATLRDDITGFAAASPRTLPEPVLPGEAAFDHILCRERKRAERTEDSLLLLLVDFSLLRQKERLQGCREAALVLPPLLRETDAYGWFRLGEVQGIVFTCLPRSGIQATRELLVQRVRDALQKGVEPELYAYLVISAIVFPETVDAPGDPLNALLYPEVVKAGPGRLADLAKRGVDLAGSLLLLVLGAPLFCVVALLIKLTSPGPVFFRQERLGAYGRVFTLLKFRSMRIDNDDAIHREFIRNFINAGGEGEKDPTTPFKIRNDPRLTPIGNFLRRSSIDELPQLVNVLTGAMSLVGPRPPIAYEVASYHPWHRLRLTRKPGITGLWQVRGRSRTTFDGMVRLDVEYIRHWSLWLDIKLLLATPLAVIRGKGAY
ncbi:sugar transferase [Geomesophilobacter sediminis]|uniref:Sugar transferase n=1 Tax=Geomesophilobacter sediminis TaxID=2798584 RepID=A0A8J7LYS2_9BACT|nr:sugar transferase [Geomesophilobacter sediminis]MBJ6725347.1 sugar transferase [Geomesophilobacter sediminis]